MSMRLQYLVALQTNKKIEHIKSFNLINFRISIHRFGNTKKKIVSTVQWQYLSKFFCFLMVEEVLNNNKIYWWIKILYLECVEIVNQQNA